MKETLKEMFTSKKFITALAGLIVALFAKIGLELNTEDVALIVAPTVVYVISQGWADKGKEAEKVKIQNENQK